MLYVEFLIDDEPYELELHPGMVFTKYAKCSQKIYGFFNETEMLCESCTPPPPDPKKKIIEYLKKHMGVTFTEEEMDTFLEKGDPKLLLDEINRRQKASSIRQALKKRGISCTPAKTDDITAFMICQCCAKAKKCPDRFSRSWHCGFVITDF